MVGISHGDEIGDRRSLVSFERKLLGVPDEVKIARLPIVQRVREKHSTTRKARCCEQQRFTVNATRGAQLPLLRC